MITLGKITISVDSDGQLNLVGTWPKHTTIKLSLIDQSDPYILWKTKNHVYFRLNNSEAVYLRLGKITKDIEHIMLERLEI